MSEPAAAGPPRYHSYVLRLWAVENDGRPVWRASLHDAHTGARHGFADLAALLAFLETQIAAAVTPRRGSGPEASQ
jgi:hypothetical protein